MSDLWRKLWMIHRLACRGAWYGVGRFSGTLVWGLTHRHCRKCKGVKGLSASSLCVHCQVRNFFRALENPL